MNRILLEHAEVAPDGLVSLEGPRARHILRVLRAKVGDRLRIGILDGPGGEGRLLGISGDTLSLECQWGDAPPAPWLDLVLALPRPKVLKRLLAPLGSLGVRQLYLTNAEKVERYYFDTHVLEPAALRERLVEGLTQSGATQLPRVRVVRQLRPFLEDEVPDLFAAHERLLLHPRGGTSMECLASGGLVLAIGPEGGWTEFELELFENCNFRQVQLGWRVLRSDVACMAAIGAVTAARSGT